MRFHKIVQEQGTWASDPYFGDLKSQYGGRERVTGGHYLVRFPDGTADVCHIIVKQTHCESDYNASQAYIEVTHRGHTQLMSATGLEVDPTRLKPKRYYIAWEGNEPIACEHHDDVEWC